MNYEPISLYLQDYINVVWVFQNKLLPNMQEIKAISEYKPYKKYDMPRSVVSYNNLLESAVSGNYAINNKPISKAAIYVLERIIDRYKVFHPRYSDNKNGIQLFFDNANLKRYPNRIMLPGYVVDGKELDDARQNLIQILSVDDHYNLIYEPEMIHKNFFVIFRQIY